MGISRSQVALRQIFRRNVVVKARNNAVVGQDRPLPSRSDLRFEIDDHVYGLMRSGDVIIDFEPQVASRREGTVLSDDGIVARFYNNVAAEYLAQGDLTSAYAHFKAAVLADPGYSPSYSNLAQLY